VQEGVKERKGASWYIYIYIYRVCVCICQGTCVSLHLYDTVHGYLCTCLYILVYACMAEKHDYKTDKVCPAHVWLVVTLHLPLDDH